jgi:hypothetical protein
MWRPWSAYPPYSGFDRRRGCRQAIDSTGKGFAIYGASAREPGGEMMPRRGKTYDGLEWLTQKQNDRERCRQRMNTPCAKVIPGESLSAGKELSG